MKKSIFSKKPKEIKSVRSAGNYNYEKHKEKYRKKRRKQNFWLRVFVTLGIIVGAVFFLNSSFFDVEKIVVEGNNYFEDEQIINISNAQTGNNIFWGSQKGEIKKRLNENSYIEKVETSMELPRTLVITIKERLPIAYLKQGKNYIVLDNQGYVLNKTTTHPKLVEIQNIKIKAAEEGQPIEVEQSRNFEKILKIMSNMKDSDVYFSKIKIDRGTVYAYVYEKLICTGQYKQLIAAMEDGKLAKVIYKLSQEGVKRGTITIGESNYISFNPV